MKMLMLAVVVACVGCCGAQDIPPSLIAHHPRIQDVCKKSMGCQHISFECRRYGSDGIGRYATLNNTTFIEIRDGDEYGVGFFTNGDPKGMDRAFEQAITDYWDNARLHAEEKAEEHNRKDRAPSFTLCNGCQ